MLADAELEGICGRLLVQSGIPIALTGDLMFLIARCFRQELRDGEIFCRENEPGDRMWFLLEGTVRVTKKDFLGLDQELSVVEAPALLGHMSLVDGSRRSATCHAMGPLRLASLDRGLYQTLVKDRGSVGDILRRLVLSSMVAQMASGSSRLQTVLDLAAKARAEPSRAGLEEVSGALHGWSPSRRGG